MAKLTYFDKEAIKEFEEITLKEEIKREMIDYNKKSDARHIPWNVHFKKHGNSIKNKIKDKFKLQFI